MCQRVSWSMNAVPYIIIHCPTNKWKHLGIAFNHFCPRSTTYTTTEPVQRQTFKDRFIIKLAENGMI